MALCQHVPLITVASRIVPAEQRGSRLHFVPRPLAELPELWSIGRDDLRRADPSGLTEHIHETMELCYIDRGTVHWWVEREFHEVSGGHVYITWPHERHGGVGAALEPCKLYWMNLFLWPGGRSGKRTLLDLPPAEARLAVDALIQLPRCFAAPSTVGGAYHRILDTLLEPKTARGLLEVRSGLLEIITTLLRAANAVEHSEHSLMVREAMKLMENHLEEPLPLPEIARKLGWSPSHFKQRFRAEVGIPPAQFYLRRRITEACRRLQSSTNNVTRIGLDLGFQSGEYFATVFKRVTGLTPRTFRERAGRS